MTYAGLKDATVRYLDQRKRSYLFGLPALLRKQKPTPDAAMMMADLTRFCRATTDTLGATTEGTYILIGRRQVFNRLMQHLHMTPEQLFELYSLHKPPKEEDQ